MPMRTASSRSAGRRVSRVQLGDRPLDAERSQDGAFGVILLRLRIAEEGHQSVAQSFQDVPAEADHRLRRLVEIGVDKVAPVLRVESSGKLGRTDKVAEHHRDRAPLGQIRRREGLRRLGGSRGRRSSRGWKGFAPVPLAYRLEQPSAVAERDFELLEIPIGEIAEHVEVNLVVPKRFLVLAEAETAEPLADFHDRAKAPETMSSAMGNIA